MTKILGEVQDQFHSRITFKMRELSQHWHVDLTAISSKAKEAPKPMSLPEEEGVVVIRIVCWNFFTLCYIPLIIVVVVVDTTPIKGYQLVVLMTGWVVESKYIHKRITDSTHEELTDDFIITHRALR